MRAFAFPGQGSQAVGMGKDFYNAWAEVRDVYDEAESVLGYDLAAISFEGPMDLLSRTDVTQPALLAHSTAVFRLLREHGVNFDCALGHSLGEYSALVATGAVSFADGLRAVKLRGEAMLQGAQAHPSGMAAVLGLEEDAVEELCAGIGEVWPANFNSPGQVVLSGSLAGLEEFERRAKEFGARKIVRLPVSGAFHSPYMDGAAVELGAFLRRLSWHTPHPAFYSVCTLTFEDGAAGQSEAAVAGAATDEAGEAVSFAGLLQDQVTAPVRFTQAVRALAAAGYGEFVEVGPGSVLSGLIRRIAPEVAVSRSGDMEAFEAAATKAAATSTEPATEV